MKVYLSGDFSPAELEQLVAFLRKLDAGRTDRTVRIWVDDGRNLTTEEASAWLHQMGMHHQVVLPADQGIEFSNEEDGLDT